jgi:predicted nucleotidyltransferase
MNRAKALQVLTRAKPELARRFGVVRLALFGSTARDEARPGSDVDIVVSFDGDLAFGDIVLTSKTLEQGNSIFLGH